ncbi:GHKL domain-containing protein [Eisenbergiella sp.]
MSNSGKLLRIASLISVTLACFFICLLLLYRYDNKYTAKGLQPVNGMLCLSEEDLAGRQLYFLTRQWQFYPDVLLTPEDFKEKTPEIYMCYTTIGEYNNFSMNNPGRNIRGSATYRLLLSLPETPRTYTLALPEIFSSYSLYIGGELLSQLGNPDPDNYLACIGNRTVSFTASGVTELLLQVTNHTHFYSGLTYPTILGEPYAVSRLLNIRLLIALSALICTVLCGLLSLYFSLTAKQSITVIFALLCLCLAGYISYPLLYTYFTVGPQPWYMLELLCIYGMYLLIIILQRYLPGKKPRLYSAMLLLLSLFCAAVFLYCLFPPRQEVLHVIFSRVSFAVKILTALYLLWHAASTVYYGETDSWLLLTCTTIFAASLLADRLMPYYEPILGKWFTEYGGLILVGAMGYTLWKDFTLSYQFRLTFAEEKRQLTRQVAIQKAHYLELTEKIEESAKQRHDQRHHLRTLYSFLSAGETRKAMDYLETYILDTMGQERAVLCSNLVIDAILQYYKNLCTRKGITFETTMELPPTLPVSDTELSILFGNLLENAWEACCREKANQFIVIRGKCKKGKLYVQLENSCTSPPLIKKGKFISSKNGKYGLGTQSVQNVVSQYDGLVEFDHTEQIFRVSVILPLPAVPSQIS